jgi:hypothetical protein
MPSPKKSEPTAVAPEPASGVQEAAPEYDRENLDHVLKRLRGIVDDIKQISGDLALHHRRATTTHSEFEPAGRARPHSYAVTPDPEMAARLHVFQASIGEFVHTLESRS